jgi:hypothetical protein
MGTTKASFISLGSIKYIAYIVGLGRASTTRRSVEASYRVAGLATNSVSRCEAGLLLASTCDRKDGQAVRTYTAADLQ